MYAKKNQDQQEGQSANGESKYPNGPGKLALVQQGYANPPVIPRRNSYDGFDPVGAGVQEFSNFCSAVLAVNANLWGWHGRQKDGQTNSEFLLFGTAYAAENPTIGFGLGFISIIFSPVYTLIRLSGLNTSSWELFKRGVNQAHVMAFHSTPNDEPPFDISAQDQETWDTQPWCYTMGGLAGWVATPAGMLGIFGVKTLNLAGRSIGISTYGSSVMKLAFNRCLNFIFGMSNETDSIQKDLDERKVTSAESFANKLALAPRVANAFGYAITAMLGVLGISYSSYVVFKRGINFATHLLFGKKYFKQEAIDEWLAQFVNMAGPNLKRRAANYLGRYGLLGWSSAALGIGIALFVKSLNLVARALLISSYSLLIMKLGYERCVNFIFGWDEKSAPNDLAKYQEEYNKIQKPLLSDKANRLALIPTLILNPIGYAITAVLGVLGISYSSWASFKRLINWSKQSLFPGSDKLFDTDGDKEWWDKQSNAKLLSKDGAGWLGRAGLLGLGAGFFGIGIVFLVKSFNLVLRGLGFSEYGMLVMKLGFLRCVNFIFRLADAKSLGLERNADKTQRQLDQFKEEAGLVALANRIALFPRSLNAVGYAITIALGVIGISASSWSLFKHNMNKVHDKLFNEGDDDDDLFNFSSAENRWWNDQADKHSKWFSHEGAGYLGRAGLLGWVMSGVGAVIVLTLKILISTARLLGFSEYGSTVMKLGYQRCINFIFGCSKDTFATQKALTDLWNDAETPSQYLNRVAILPRAANALGYGITGFLGLIGISYTSWVQFKRIINFATNKCFGKEYFDPSQAWWIDIGKARPVGGAPNDHQYGRRDAAVLGRINIFGNALALAGIVITGVVKLLNLAGRALAFSEYGRLLMKLAFRQCVNFVFGLSLNTDEIQTELDKKKTEIGAAAKASRVAIFPRLFNALGYSITAGLGVLGISAVSWHTFMRGINMAYGQLFGGQVFDTSPEDKKWWDDQSTAPWFSIGTANWFGRAGLLGVLMTAVGGLFLGAVKIVNLLARTLGVSEYGFTIMKLGFQRCTNFIFGWGQSTNQTQEDLAKLVTDEKNQAVNYANQVAGIPYVLNTIGYGITFGLGVFGISYTSLITFKRMVNWATQGLFGKTYFEIDENFFHGRYIGDPRDRAGAYGVLGWLAASVGIAIAVIVKVVNFASRSLGISKYGKLVMKLGYQRCMNFIFGSDHNTKETQDAINLLQNPEGRKEKLNTMAFFPRVLNGFGYGITFMLGVFGISASSIGAFKRCMNFVTGGMFGEGQALFDTESSKAWWDGHKGAAYIGRFGLFGMVLTAIGVTIALIIRLCISGASLLGYSEYGSKVNLLGYQRCNNFLKGTEEDAAKTQGELDALWEGNKTFLGFLDKIALIPRLYNGLKYAITAALSFIGFNHRVSHRYGLWFGDNADRQGHKEALTKANKTPLGFLADYFNIIGGVPRLAFTALWVFGAPISGVWMGLKRLFGGYPEAAACASQDPIKLINQKFSDLINALGSDGHFVSDNLRNDVANTKDRPESEKRARFIKRDISQVVGVFWTTTPEEKVIKTFKNHFEIYLSRNRITAAQADGALADFFDGKFETMVRALEQSNPNSDIRNIAERVKAQLLGQAAPAVSHRPGNVNEELEPGSVDIDISGVLVPN